MNDNPTAMITGASRGLGRALAAGLAREGFALIIDARNAAALDAAAEAIRAAGGRVTAIAGDVTDPAHRAALRKAADAAGRLDLLVNNAGTLGASPLPALADYPPDELRAAFEVNVIAPIALTQLMLPLLRAGGGAVLNITSDAAVEAYAGWGGYGAAKAALEQASNVLAAEELAAPGLVGRSRRPAHRHAPAGLPRADISDRPEPESVVPAFVRLIAQRLPSGRYRAAHLMPGSGSTWSPATDDFTPTDSRWPISRCPPSSRRTTRPRRAAWPGTASGCWSAAGRPARSAIMASATCPACCSPATCWSSIPPRRCRPRCAPTTGWPCTSPARGPTARGWLSSGRSRARSQCRTVPAFPVSASTCLAGRS